LFLDNDDALAGAYPKLPQNWRLVMGERATLSEIYNRALYMAPLAPWYGILADDIVPETQYWDTTLAAVADGKYMAVPDGGHDINGAPHFVLGGGLVREIGWIALHGLQRLYIDTVWIDIAKSKGVFRRVPEVVLKHHHFSNKLALMDKTYRKTPELKAHDKKVYQQWKSATGGIYGHST